MIEKHFDFLSERQIYRLLISETDRLVVETRNSSSKEVFYDCVDLGKAENIFLALQLDEKIWLGIETVKDNLIFFHKFPKPDLPGHKEIIAFDIESQTVIWRNSDLTFHFVLNDLVYGFQQGFEERFFYTLDIRTGNVVDDLGNNHALVHERFKISEQQRNWDNYKYPMSFAHIHNPQIKTIINDYLSKFSTIDETEYCLVNELLVFNFHENAGVNTLNNRFTIIDLASNKILVEDILNENVASVFPDSFFVYKDYLFVLKGKNGFTIYKV